MSEIIIKQDKETLEKIKTLCQPFAFNTGIQLVITTQNISDHKAKRLFLLAGPDTIKNNFKNPDDCLAIALCIDLPKSTLIQYFEVNYNFRHSYDPNQKYNRVGTSAINALKEAYKTRELYGKSALEAVKFWLKNGFTRIDEREQHLHWRNR